MTPSTTAGRGYPDWFDAGLSSQRVIAVLRGFSPAATVELANAAWDLGVTQVEVPIESPSAVPSLEAAIAAGRDRGVRVGAGTIVTPEQLRCAEVAGAAYLVSPGFDPDLIALADRAALPMLPGVATASEMLRAQSMGFEWVKGFPASVLGAAWFAAMNGPFPAMRLVATGGVTGHNAAEFLAAGASVVGVGGAFGDPGHVDQLAAALVFRDGLP